MYNGMLIQDLDIKDVSSERRNPILANVMAQLDYMEKRGSGLTRICNETKALEGYKDELKPVFKSTPTQFQTIIFATSDTQNVGDSDGDVSETKLTYKAFPNPNSCNVTVPCGSLEAYTSSQWNNYFPNRIEEDCSSALQEVESTR